MKMFDSIFRKFYNFTLKWATERKFSKFSGLCPSDRELIGDHAVGAYLTLSPEFCFVAENSADGTIVAYAVAAPDAKSFQTRYHGEWLSEMRAKYPRKALELASNEVIDAFLPSFNLINHTWLFSLFLLCFFFQSLICRRFKAFFYRYFLKSNWFWCGKCYSPKNVKPKK